MERRRSLRCTHWGLVCSDALRLSAGAAAAAAGPPEADDARAARQGAGAQGKAAGVLRVVVVVGGGGGGGGALYAGVCLVGGAALVWPLAAHQLPALFSAQRKRMLNKMTRKM